MSLREWLIIAGAVIIIGLLVDSVRRIQRARRDSLEVSRGMGAQDLDVSPIDEDYNPELPNGGARTVSREGPSGEQGARRPLFAKKPVKPTRRIIDQQPAPPEPPAREPEPPHSAEALESFSAIREESIEPGETFSAVEEASQSREESRAETIPELTEAAVDPHATSLDQRPSRSPDAPGDSDRSREAVEELEKLRDLEAVDRAAPTQPSRPAASDGKADRPLAGANRPAAQEVVVINVHSRAEAGFRGADLRKLFEGCGMEFGDMDIYHRHEEPDTSSPVQFSVASAVKPGTFDPGTMDRETYEGISFFMSLPGPSDSLEAFKYMLETAQCVVSNLGGELKDERQSVMTAQTTEHCRQRIREFERKRRSVRA